MPEDPPNTFRSIGTIAAGIVEAEAVRRMTNEDPAMAVAEQFANVRTFAPSHDRRAEVKAIIVTAVQAHQLTPDEGMHYIAALNLRGA